MLVETSTLVQVGIHATDHCQTELARQLEPARVEGTDELGAFFDDAAVAELAVAVDPPADEGPCFKEAHRDALPNELPRRHQAGKAAADHGNAADAFERFSARSILEAQVFGALQSFGRA